MDYQFKKIAITWPGAVSNEASKIASLLEEEGYDYVHIRKPDWTLRDVRNLIEDIPYRLRRQLKLHGHFQLLSEMQLGGAHLNSRNPNVPDCALKLSRSCHTLSEIDDLSTNGYEYVTLSPIFDSISKEGYRSQFKLDAISERIKGKNVVALGGVTPAHFKILEEKGFYGAALLGYIWKSNF